MGVMKLKAIDIVFENCEVVHIPIEYLFFLSLNKITMSLRVDFGRVTGSINSESTKIVLKSSANDLHTDMEPNMKLFDRIMEHNDIAAVDLITDNDESTYYYVDWCWDNDYRNSYQHNKIMENGDLVVYIGKDFEEEDEEDNTK